VRPPPRAEHTAQLAELVAAMTAHQDDLPRLQTLALQFWNVLVVGSGNIAYQLVFNSLRDTYERLRELLVDVLSAELATSRPTARSPRPCSASDDLSAAAVARALMEQGSSAIFQLIAAIEEVEDGDQMSSAPPQVRRARGPSLWTALRVFFSFHSPRTFAVVLPLAAALRCGSATSAGGTSP
jgi:GntR family transcriptional repressor for pyruvate dehydrogenase complex